VQIYAEVDIRSIENTSIIEQVLKEFSSQQQAWNYDEEKSKNYSLALVEGIGFVMTYDRGDQLLGIALSEAKPKQVRLSNITPEKSGQLSISEYNEVASLLHNDLKEWCKKNKRKLKFSISNTNPDLDEIITANIPRKAFEAFLNNYPLSSHPSDIGRLDRFICSVAKYSRKSINWEHLGKYLQEQHQWSGDDIENCINRIDIGLDVLRQYKKFY